MSYLRGHLKMPILELLPLPLTTDEDLYGSIAFSQEPGGGYAWGMAWDHDNLTAARRQAVAACQDRGGSNCAEQVWFRNACGALYIGDGNGWGSGWGRTKSIAEDMARGQCRSRNSNCQQAASQCVTPPRPERRVSVNSAELFHWLAREGLSESKARILDLLDKGADPNFVDTAGNTPMHYAALWNLTEDVLLALIRHGGHCDARNIDGETPLHFAANLTWPTVHDFPQRLTNCGADPNALDKHGNTPLHMSFLPLARNYFSWQGSIVLQSRSYTANDDTIRRLLNYGSDPNIKNADGHSAMMLALKLTAPPHIIELLLAHDADPNTRDSRGIPALVVTLMEYDLYSHGDAAEEIVDLLLETAATTTTGLPSISRPQTSACR